MDVGAHERELAMEALDAHRRAGRLERGEHASRCSAASRATSRAQLEALFADLPDPHPAYPTTSQAPQAPPTERRGAGPVPELPELPELVAPAGATIARHAGLISLLTPAVAALLFAVSGGRFPWIFILVPIVIAGVAVISHRHER
ncbi:uncharacterized protein DUF1707 [Actinomycetospora succinea]|uniref:Uncharacterized protein DUF1707 n=1 Tax=Actinomycetospora succinea TaxID=663603 RepID=A0A4R6VQY8_9PSEU|nr:DUF1707 domain-containing protein [Actinomycetospora succinea]TDQ64944.1 uncharacterized protein DUF1707 [Actinomycetospora succinea]